MPKRIEALRNLGITKEEIEKEIRAQGISSEVDLIGLVSCTISHMVAGENLKTAIKSCLKHVDPK